METISTLSLEVNRLHADLCSALADPTRILLIYLLAEQTYTVSELSEKLGASQPTTSRHLKVLRERGLVGAERRGQNVEYTLRDLRLVESLDTLRAVLRESLSRRAGLMQEEVS